MMSEEISEEIDLCGDSPSALRFYESHEKLLKGKQRGMNGMSRQQRQRHARLSLLALGEISKDIA